jgi:hypothetical protein
LGQAARDCAAQLVGPTGTREAAMVVDGCLHARDDSADNDHGAVEVDDHCRQQNPCSPPAGGAGHGRHKALPTRAQRHRARWEPDGWPRLCLLAAKRQGYDDPDDHQRLPRAVTCPAGTHRGSRKRRGRLRRGGETGCPPRPRAGRCRRHQGRGDQPGHHQAQSQGSGHLLLALALSRGR